MVPAMNNIILLAAGGDERSAGLCRILTEKLPCNAFSLALGDVPGAKTLSSLSEMRFQPDLLVLPLPVSSDGVHLRTVFSEERIPLKHLLDLCRRGTRVYCGKADDALREGCRERGLPLNDYLDDEAFTVKNAAATAEAALALAFDLRKKVFFGSTALILGGGRIAKNLIRLLTAYGVRVICTARSPEQRTWASLMGARAVPFGEIPDPGRIDMVFSTVPRTVFGEAELVLLRQDCLLIELGSLPGGIDEDAARNQGRHLVRASSLPGKTVPASASEWLAELILEKEAAFLDKN